MNDTARRARGLGWRSRVLLGYLEKQHTAVTSAGLRRAIVGMSELDSQWLRNELSRWLSLQYQKGLLNRQGEPRYFAYALSERGKQQLKSTKTHD